LVGPVTKVVNDAGGKILARSNKYTPIKCAEPKPQTIIEVVEYETTEKAEIAYFSPVWNDARKLGNIYTNPGILVVEGVPQ
jgi:uncharacterized protein (DUF1330 family)